MKVDIKKPRPYFGPTHLAERVLFWLPEDHPWVDALSDIIAYGKIQPERTGRRLLFDTEIESRTWLYKFMLWLNRKLEPRPMVRIDAWDTWCMPSTLNKIILPMLIQLKQKKSGAPYVDNDDVPQHLRFSRDQQDAYSKNGTTDDVFFQRWDWVLDEMIHAFQRLDDDEWEQQYHSGDVELVSVPVDSQDNEITDGSPAAWYRLENGPNHTHVVDRAGLEQEYQRIHNGLRLFGKYYRDLWS